ncbi:hypothetical protein [Microcella humidisoli]|uniref:Uncharacterized protein n=1 Tax=Microcella humidisoli TaxID=2963406 RepID=A0ABY5FVX0_9MICO|nr:hypothetical protein [Microcella humidisoli]UTT62446.1 hypothetical protein NNL39_12450 [Microcella humidisoli]
MSMPLDDAAEPPPVAAFATDQYDVARDQFDGVMRQWLSSIRPTYRRAVRGRTERADAVLGLMRGRHRAT